MSDREAIFWTSTRANFNQRDRELVRFEGGEKIVEKVPQRGHQGEWDSRRIDPRSAATRWIHVCRDDGNHIRMVLTNAAAHVDPFTEFGQYQRAKARYFGWFPIGSCPLALIATGEIKREQMVDQTILDQPSCRPGSYNETQPCPHVVAETKARRARKARIEAERNAAYKDSTDRQIEASRADSREQTAAIQQQTETLREVLEAMKPKAGQKPKESGTT